MTSAKLAVIFLAWFAFAASANAQRAESESASERDNRAAAPTPPTPGISEEAPADNSTAATANSLSICQMVESAAAANGLPFEFLKEGMI